MKEPFHKYCKSKFCHNTNLQIHVFCSRGYIDEPSRELHGGLPFLL